MKNDKFEDIKIKMVMKLKRLSRPAAVAELARMDAERKAAEVKETEERRRKAGSVRGVDPANALVHNGDLLDDMLSAEEFFGED